MPRSDDAYDLVHTYDQAKAGKSKTTRPAVREIGRDGAAVETYVSEEQTEADVRTPPSGIHLLFFNESGDLRQKDPDGSVTGIGGGAPTDADYVTTSSDPDLSNETVAGVLSDVYGSPVSAGAAVDLGGNDITDVGSISAEQRDNDRIVAPGDDLQTKINNASDGDRVIVVGPGTHTLSSTVDINTRITLDLRTDITVDGDHTALKQTASWVRWSCGRDVRIHDNNNTTGSSTNGLEIKAQFIIDNVVWVRNFGQDGVALQQDDSEGSDSLNHSHGGFAADNNGRHGVRMVNVGSSETNLNTMDLNIHAFANGSRGFQANDGKRNKVFLDVQNNTNEGGFISGDDWEITLDSEGNGARSNFRGGSDIRVNLLNSDQPSPNAIVDGSDPRSVVVEGNRFGTHQGGNTVPLEVENTNATNFNRSVDMGYRTANGVVARMRARGDDVFGAWLNRASDFEVLNSDGGGLVLTTPNGSDRYRIRVDNNGNVVTDGPL